MNRTSASAIANPQPKPGLLAALAKVLFTAFLLFELAAPFASANCYNKGFTQQQPTPVLPALPALVEHPAAPISDTSAPVSIVGLWNVTFTSGGQVVDMAFDAWHSDGTEILNDYTDPIEGNVCLGVYEKIGSVSYKLTHPSWSFDNTGKLLGTVVINEIVHVSADGNSYTGTYTYDIYDISGTLQEEFKGRVAAKRIVPA